EHSDARGGRLCGPRSDLTGTQIRPASVHGDGDHRSVRSGELFACVRSDDLTPLVVSTDRTDPVGTPRTVALRALVVRRRADLVLRATLGSTSVRLLLLRDGHGLAV